MCTARCRAGFSMVCNAAKMCIRDSIIGEVVQQTVAARIREMDVDVIVGPAMGGIVYAYELARQTGKLSLIHISDKITAAEIHNEIFGSDHCPVELQIDL